MAEEFPYKKFTVSKQGVECYALSRQFIKKYNLSEEQL